MRVFLHIVILGCSVILTFFWVTNEVLAGLSLQLTGILVLALILTRRMLKPVSFRLVESTVSTMAVLLIATATGGLSSPLFFLNYFLLFELSLLLEPIIPLILSVILIGFYLYTNEIGGSPFHLLELLSFPFMTPLAFLFGKIYKKEENQKKEIKGLKKKIERLEDELAEEEMGEHQ